MTSSTPLGSHRQKAQGLGCTAVSYEKVEAVPTSPVHPAEVTDLRIRQATLLTCTGVGNQTQNDRTLINLLRYAGSAFTYPGQLGRSKVLSRLSPRIRLFSAGKSFRIVSRAQGWSKFGMCTGRGGVRVTIEHGLYRRTQKYTEPAITRASLAFICLP